MATACITDFCANYKPAYDGMTVGVIKTVGRIAKRLEFRLQAARRDAPQLICIHALCRLKAGLLT